MKARLHTVLRRAACWYFGHQYTGFFGEHGTDPYAPIYCRLCGKELLP